MNDQLTPGIVKSVYGKYLSLADAQCLLDLFTNQATEGQWLDSNTVASWMYRTNKPTDFQLKRAKSLLHKLSSSQIDSCKKPYLLDMQIKSEDTGYGSMVVKATYKLSRNSPMTYVKSACIG